MEADVALADVSLTVQNQVHLGRPVWWGHSAGGRLMAARRTHKWYWDGLARAMWSNKRSHLALIVEVTGGWLVLCLTSSLVTWATYGIRRMRHMHHWSNASRRRLETELMHHVSITDHYHCDYLHQSSITINHHHHQYYQVCKFSAAIVLKSQLSWICAPTANFWMMSQVAKSPRFVQISVFGPVWLLGDFRDVTHQWYDH